MTRPVLLVTGGSRGIGAAICTMAAARGYDVAVNYQSNAETAAAVVKACGAAGARAVALQGDMSLQTDIARVFNEAAAALGPPTHSPFGPASSGHIGQMAYDNKYIYVYVGTNEWKKAELSTWSDEFLRMEDGWKVLRTNDDDFILLE